MPDRDVRNIWHKKQEATQVLEGTPQPQDLDEGVLRIYNIPSYGLYLVVKYKGKLQYIKFNDAKDKFRLNGDIYANNVYS